MNTIDWSHFTQRININAPVEALYKTFATRNGMESWFLRLCEYRHTNNTLLAVDEFIKTGDKYKWLWHGWPDSTAETGIFIKANDKDELQFQFGNAGIVTVKIYTAESVSIVELKQENIPLDEQSKLNYYVGCSTGWVFYLANLKSIMEGGIDLRNKSENIRGVLNS